jgi:hypothetical protein
VKAPPSGPEESRPLLPFAVAPRAGMVNFSIVETANDQLAAPLRDALLRLLDDPSPSVRQALLADFARRGGPALRFLRAVAGGADPAGATQARWFLEQLRSSDPIVEFKAFIRSLHYELETGLLLLARTVTPDLDAAACCAQLDALAARCRELVNHYAATGDAEHARLFAEFVEEFETTYERHTT